MVKVRLEIGMLLDGMQYNEYLAWQEAAADLPPGDSTSYLVDDYLSKFPLTVFVDREVWHSVDKHSFDRYILSVVVDPCILSDDQLEDLADHEDMQRTIVEIFGEGREWVLSLEPLI